MHSEKEFMGKPKVTSARAEQRPASGLMQKLIAKNAPTASTRREGYPIPMNLLSNNKLGVAEYGLDLSEAPVPSRRYAADLCSVRSASGEMRIIFAQYGFDEEDIESALIIRMSRSAVRQFADSLSGMGANLSGLTVPFKLRDEPLSNIEAKPSQVANMMANICSVAVAGQEACLDFYHVSAFAIRKVEFGNSAMEIEPVVRVDMRSSLFVAFARRAIEIAEQIKNEDEK